MRFVLLVLVFLLSPLGAVQAEIFTWKDENGKTHFGDKVPEKYKDNNTEVEVGPVNSADPEKTVKRKTAYNPGPSPGYYDPKVATPPKAKPQSCAEKKAAYQRAKACFDGCRTFEYDRNLGRKVGHMNAQCASRCGPNKSKPNC